jgi:hypothetical protein
MQHSFTHPRLVLAAVVFGAAAFLGGRDGWTAPAKAGYPNPAPLFVPLTWTQWLAAQVPPATGPTILTALGHVRRTGEPIPFAAVPPLDITGTRQLSFNDLINPPASTSYAVYVWLDGNPGPAPGSAIPAPVGATYWATSIGPGVAGPFTCTPPLGILTVNDNPLDTGDTYSTLQPEWTNFGANVLVPAGLPDFAERPTSYLYNRYWNWRVDVTNTVTGFQAGDVWQFRIPLEAPSDGSQNVSVYCKFEWEPSSFYTSGISGESCYILDPNVQTQVTQGWYATGGGPNTALTHTDVNLVPKTPLYYGLWPYWREFWIHSTTYAFQKFARLQPGTTYEWRIWYSPTGAGSVNATVTGMLPIPAGANATFTANDPAGNNGTGLTVTCTLNNVPATPGALAAAVRAAIQAAAPVGSNIRKFVVADITPPGQVTPQIVKLMWPLAGEAGNAVTMTIPAAKTAYLSTNPLPAGEALPGPQAQLTIKFSSSGDPSGFYGPIYTFTTANEALVDAVDGDAAGNYDPAVEGLIVFWQHPQGTLARDPEENCSSFWPIAKQLQAIHSNDLQPSVKTLIFGTEEIAASYGGLDSFFQAKGQNSTQQVYVPDITQFPGWYEINGVVLDYNTRIEAAGYPATLPVGTDTPLFYSSADQPLGAHLYATQDRYYPWVAEGIRTWLEDAANQQEFGAATNDHAWLPYLKYITLLGDASRVAPSFYYYYEPFTDLSGMVNNRWLPTDFFYTTQNGQTPAVVSITVGTIPTGGTNNAGGFEVSRIPIRALPMPYTIDQQYETNTPQQFPPIPSAVYDNPYYTDQFPPDPPLSVPYKYTPATGAEYASTGYFDPAPFLSKIRSYCDLLNSFPTETAKTTAFSTWFRQVVMVDGATEYYKWFQFFPGLAQYLLSLQVQPVVGGPLHDAFSGMVVRKYDLNGTTADDGGTAANDESLTLSNILGRMSIDNGYDVNTWNNNTADTDVPGFVYLLARGGTNYGGEDSDIGVTDIESETLAGGAVDLTPADAFTGPFAGLSNYNYDPTELSPYALELTLTVQWFPTYIQTVPGYAPPASIPHPSPANFPTATTKARPIMVSPANVITRFDTALWGLNPNTGYGSNPNTTLGEMAIQAQGGPIAIAGFTSGRYETSIQYGAGDTDTESDITYTGPTDQNEGYEFPTIGPTTYVPTNTYGTADLTQFSADTDALLGKVELTSYLATWYALSTSPTDGYLFNQALAQYVNLHVDDFTINGAREATTIFGATLLGDSALSMPGPTPMGTLGLSDYPRPTVTDTTSRAATVVTGYSPISPYNSQNMPVHVIAQYVSPPYVTLATNPKATATNEGATVALQIETTAPHVRVRVFTPFRQNTAYSSGEWVAQAGPSPPAAGVDLLQNASGYSLTGSDGSKSATNELICSVPAGVVTVTFDVLTPSVYFVVIQAEAPAWTNQAPATPQPYQWLQERWFYIQAVNQWYRLDPTGKVNNLLVVDMDQHDRYFLNGDVSWQHQITSATHVLPPVPANIDSYFWDIMADTYYVDPTQPDGTGYVAGETPTEVAGASDSPALPYLNSLVTTPAAGSPKSTNNYQYQFWCGNVFHTLATFGNQILASQRYCGEITPDALASYQGTDGVVLWFTGDWDIDLPKGYLFQFEPLVPPETGYLSSYLTNTGRLWMDSQDLTTESDNSLMALAGAFGESTRRLATAEPYAATFLSDYLGATPKTLDTGGSILDGNLFGTMSGGFSPDTDAINGVDDIGGDGRNSLNWASEVDPLNLTELAATVFKWSSPSGVVISTGTKSAAMQNILPAGGVRGKEAFAGGPGAFTGGQAIFFTWPLESVNHLGDITDDTSGRAYMLKAVIDWLSSTTKPVLPGPVSNMLPANGSTTTTLTPVFSWTAGLDATSYILEYGPGNTLPLSPTIVPLVPTTYTPKTALTLGATYTWTVFSVNAYGETAGPIQTFIAHVSAVPPASTSTSTTAVAGGGGGGGGGCFIATAAYESADGHAAGVVETNCTGAYVITPERLRQLNDIRSLRDDLLVQFPAGRVFSAWYYAIGPYGAEAYRGNEQAKAAVCVMLLDPLAELSRECAQGEKK